MLLTEVLLHRGRVIRQESFVRRVAKMRAALDSYVWQPQPAVLPKPIEPPY